MKQMLKTILSAAVAVMLLGTAALAETVSMDGTVTASYTYEIYAASSGTVQTVYVTAGQTVEEDTAIASLRTTKVYAETDGVVSAVFGEAGDDLETVAGIYGAAIYLDTAVTYTVSASTEQAYDSVATKLVRIGETVYLRSRSALERTGIAIVTAIDESGYSLHVTDGDFIVGETVNIYRSTAFADSERLGRGDITRNTPMAVSGAGRIVSMAVQAGDAVKKGDLLMETLEGSGSSATIQAGIFGVVAQVNAAQGEHLEEGAVAAVIYPGDAMQIETCIHEADLAYIAVGDAVTLTFDWNSDSGETMEGSVSSISAVSDPENENTVFRTIISFEPNDNVRYGMNVTITTIE